MGDVVEYGIMWELGYMRKGGKRGNKAWVWRISDGEWGLYRKTTLFDRIYKLFYRIRSIRPNERSYLAEYRTSQHFLHYRIRPNEAVI